MCIKALRVLAQRETHGVTHGRYAVQRKATPAQCKPKQCNNCCGLLFANKTSTQYGFVYLRVGREWVEGISV